MTNSENSSTTQSHGKLIAVVVAAAVVIILAVLSAFVWPGWAIQKNDGTSTTTQNSQQKTESSEPTKPTIDATALPDDASELLKAMPGSVLNYARTKADASTTWNSASPLEEYTLTYSTGDAAKDVTLVAAQWSSAASNRALSRTCSYWTSEARNCPTSSSTNCRCTTTVMNLTSKSCGCSTRKDSTKSY